MKGKNPLIVIIQNDIKKIYFVQAHKYNQLSNLRLEFKFDAQNDALVLAIHS